MLGTGLAGGMPCRRGWRSAGEGAGVLVRKGTLGVAGTAVSCAPGSSQARPRSAVLEGTGERLSRRVPRALGAFSTRDRARSCRSDKGLQPPSRTHLERARGWVSSPSGRSPRSGPLGVIATGVEGRLDGRFRAPVVSHQGDPHGQPALHTLPYPVCPGGGCPGDMCLTQWQGKDRRAKSWGGVYY